MKADKNKNIATAPVAAPEQSGPAKLSPRGQAEQVRDTALAIAVSVVSFTGEREQTIASQALANAEAAQRLLALLP